MAVNRRLVKVMNCAIVERVFWLVNCDTDEEATQRLALPSAGGTNSRNGTNRSPRFAIFAGVTSRPVHLGMTACHYFPRKNVPPPCRKSEEK